MPAEEVMEVLVIKVHCIFYEQSWVTFLYLGNFGDFKLPSDILTVVNVIE